MLVSFKKIYNKINLPTLKIKIKDKYYLFLVDTGSDVSYINEDIIDNSFKEIGYTKFIDYTSNIRKIRMFDIPFSIGKKKFRGVFGENICCDSFETLEKENKIKLSGIIGSKVMNDLNIVINFDSMTISV
jgi:hypothetical protein